MVSHDRRCPQTIGGNGKGLKYKEYVRAAFKDGTRDRIKAVLHQGEMPADLFRNSVERELERREAEAKD